MPPPAPVPRAAFLVVLALLCLALAAALLAGGQRRRAPPGHPGGLGPLRAAVGGGRLPARESPHLVVDTLNLAHWLSGGSETVRLSPERIAEAIDRTAPELRKRYQGRVMYVLKDRESRFSSDADREAYRLAAVRNRVYVCAAERYADPPKGVDPSSAHSARGRDDFYMALLAWKWRCPVATEDRLRDFSQLRATIQPFHVYEWAYWREAPSRDFIRPEAPTYARVRKPRAIRFGALGLGAAGRREKEGLAGSTAR